MGGKHRSAVHQSESLPVQGGEGGGGIASAQSDSLPMQWQSMSDCQCTNPSDGQQARDRDE